MNDLAPGAVAQVSAMPISLERSVGMLTAPSVRPERQSAPWWLCAARMLVRLAGIVILVAAGLADYFYRIWLAGRAGNTARQAQWLSRWSRCLLRLLNVRLVGLGTPPESGLLVSNHLSYLDILVLASVQPCVFAAQAEVGNWPLLGLLARLAGTLFVRRDHGAEVGGLNHQLFPNKNIREVVVLFPEGTSGDGHRVLPFHSALLAPAVANGWRVTPAWLGYSLADGSVEDEVCYWRDMTFLPHFLNLLTKRAIHACLAFGDPVTAGPDRKRLSRELRDRVVDLGQAAGTLLR